LGSKTYYRFFEIAPLDKPKPVDIDSYIYDTSNSLFEFDGYRYQDEHQEFVYRSKGLYDSK
jgi:hypothetical protein